MSFNSTITDTCKCGASFVASGSHADPTHKRWLEAHKECREK